MPLKNILESVMFDRKDLERVFSRQYFFLIVLAGLLTLLSWSRIDRMAVADELVFFDWVGALIYNGQLSGIHPEGYTIYLAIPAWLFGLTTEILRISTLLLVIAAIPCVYWLAVIAQSIVSEERLADGWSNNHRLPLLAVLLFSISPLVIATATMIDMEAAYVVLTPIFFALFFIAFESNRSQKVLWLSGITILGSLLLWVKIGIFPALVVSGSIYLILRRDLAGVVEYGISVTGAGCIFLCSWWAITAVTGTDPFAFLGTDAGMIRGSAFFFSPRSSLKVTGWVGSIEIMWISPFLLILASISVLDQDLIRFKLSKPKPSFLLVLFSMLTVCQYVVLTKLPFGFPKYMGRTIPVLAVAASFTVAIYLPTIIERRSQVVSIGTVSVLGIGTYLLPDPYILPLAGNFGTDLEFMLEHWISTWGPFVILTIIILLGSSYYLYRNRYLKREYVKKLIVLSLLLMLIGTNSGFAVTQATVEYNTHYYYGMSNSEAINQYWTDRPCTAVFDYITPSESLRGVPSEVRQQCIDHSNISTALSYNP